MEELQLQRLKAVIERVMEQVPFYRKKFANINFSSEKLTSLLEMKALPFTTKKDLRENYPFGRTKVLLPKFHIEEKSLLDSSPSLPLSLQCSKYRKASY